MGIELPTGIQQVIDQSNSQAPQVAAASRAEQPGGLGIAPAGQQDAAPDAPPQHPVDRLADAFISRLLDRDKASQPSKPAQAGDTGSFADKLRAAGNSVGASLGDASHATDNLKPGQGALSGVMNTLAARHDRMSREHDAKEASDRQKRNDQMLTARNNIEMAVSQQRLANEKQEFQDKVYARNNASVAQQEKDGYTVERGITENDLQQRMKDFKGEPGQHWTDLYDARPSGSIDVNGKSIPTYNVVTLKNEPVTISDTDRANIKTNGGADLPEGTKVSYPAYRAMMNKAEAVASGRAALEEANGKALSAEQKKLADTAAASPAGQTALSKYPEDRVRGVFEAWGTANDHVKNGEQLLKAAQQHGDPAAIQEAQQYLKSAQAEQKNLHDIAVYGFDKDAIAQHDAMTKARETARHDAAEEAIQNKRADIAANKEVEQKGLGDSYKVQNKEFDTIRKPVDTKLESLSTLRSTLDAAGNDNAVAASVVAPALLKALVAGGGVRITQAEISQLLGARSNAGEVEVMLKKWQNGMKLSSTQIKQIYDLVGLVEVKAQAARQALEDGQEALDNAGDIASQRKAVSDTRRKIAAIESGQSTPNQSTSNSGGQKQALPTGHKVGDIITQNGQHMKVTSVDASGKVTGAE